MFAAPDLGRFTGECIVGATRKADIVVRLWDGRVMPIECKVSNSELNSIKRLTNDALVKARAWIDDLGRNNVVPVAVLSGVFGLQQHLYRGAGAKASRSSGAHSLDELLSFVAENTGAAGSRPHRRQDAATECAISCAVLLERVVELVDWRSGERSLELPPPRYSTR